MKIQIQSFVVLVLVGVFGLSGLADARPPKSAEEGGEKTAYRQKKWEGKFKDKKECNFDKGKFKEKMKVKLDLTDEQQQKLEEHRKTHWKQGKQYKASVKEVREQLKEELEKKDFDLGKIKALHEQLKSLKNQMEDHQLQGILEVREILTAEQFKKFHEFKERKKEKWGGKQGYHKKGGSKIISPDDQ